MKVHRKKYPFFIFCILVVLIASSCSQYEYTSPLPGTISVRLKTKSSGITFDPLNNFVLKVTSVEAVRSDGARAPIYEDTKAINRTTNVYNTLDVRARDSSLVMGEALLPPGDYIGVNLLITPGSSVILDGYRNIPVIVDPKFDPLLAFRNATNPGATLFHISEGVATSMVVTIDLDSTLLKGANVYYFRPYYYVSSIQ
jgi:hypothetical protein